MGTLHLQHQKMGSTVADKGEDGKSKQQGREGQPTATTTAKQQPHTTTISSPPSSSSSPSHEFSFTISLHHSSSTTVPEKTKSSPPSAIDLSPADDIFFHGHLLPLHLLSHLPISPRSSTNSLDNFTLPIRDLLEDGKPNNNSSSSNNNIKTTTTKSMSNINNNHHSNTSETKGRRKVKSFSLFGITRWRKGCEVRERYEGEEEEEEEEKKKKRKMRFDVSHILKRYVRIVRPLFLFRGGRRENRQSIRQSYSFSGDLSLRGKSQWRGRRGEFSAPASMRTSPTNSGLLVATATLPSATSDSTMEELQAAIQAAIAHCKNSISVKEEKLKISNPKDSSLEF